MPPAGATILLAGLDAELAGHITAALLRYQKWLEDIDRPLPDGLAELLDTTLRVAKSGQSHHLDAATRHRVRMARLIQTSDAAEVLGCSERTVRRRVADGTLPAHRIGRLVRFAPSDLLTLIEAS